jgi:hypothetical protein
MVPTKNLIFPFTVTSWEKPVAGRYSSSAKAVQYLRRRTTDDDFM